MAILVDWNTIRCCHCDRARLRDCIRGAHSDRAGRVDLADRSTLRRSRDHLANARPDSTQINLFCDIPGPTWSPSKSIRFDFAEHRTIDERLNLDHRGGGAVCLNGFLTVSNETVQTASVLVFDRRSGLNSASRERSQRTSTTERRRTLKRLRKSIVSWWQK